MSDHNEHDNQNSDNHDDCDDCKRERAENQKLIDIYQKLQQVDKKTYNAKLLVNQHKDNFQKSSLMLRSFEDKVNHIQNRKNQQKYAQFQEIGYNLYAQLIQTQRKSPFQKENQRLRLVLKNLQTLSNVKQPNIQKVNDSTTNPQMKIVLPNTGQLPQILSLLNQNPEQSALSWFSKREKQINYDNKTQRSFEETTISMGKSFQISSTKSSFNITKRRSFDKKDFQEMNLWLFDQRNQLLEKDLYEGKQLQDQKVTPNLTNLTKKERQTRNLSRLNDFNKLNTSSKHQKNESFLLTRKKMPQISQRPDQIIKVNSDRKSTVFQTSTGKLFTKKNKRGAVLPAILKK